MKKHYQYKIDVSNLVPYLSWTPIYVSGTWLGVAPRTDTKKTCLKEIGLHAQNMISILGSIVSMIGRTYMTTY